MASPQTMVETEVFDYSDCDYTMTATATVYVGGTPFRADIVTYTFLNPSKPLTVTFNYPGVTVSSLVPGETLTFVQSLIMLELTL